jgi:GNAT superfamily N-acetyltransferase
MRVRIATQNDALAIANVHVKAWQTTYRGIISDEYLDGLSYSHREAIWNDILSNPATNRSFVYVAENEAGQIIGFASGGKERSHNLLYTGELMAVYILEPYQRQGVGRYLVRAIAHHLAKENIHSLLVWALAENPACQFYAALGGQRIDEKEIVIGGQALLEYAYGWTNTNILMALKNRA